MVSSSQFPHTEEVYTREGGPGGVKPSIPEGGGAACACRLLSKPVKPCKPKHPHTSLEAPIADFQPFKTPKADTLLTESSEKFAFLQGIPVKFGNFHLHEAVYTLAPYKLLLSASG